LSLVSSGNPGLYFVNGIVDDANGCLPMAAFVGFGNFELMSRSAQVFKRIIHVRLIGGMGILDENAAGEDDAEGERDEEMAKVKFHG